MGLSGFITGMKTKTPRKRKPKTLRGLVDDLAVALQKHVRLKAADSNGYVSCVTCEAQGKRTVKHWKEMQGGHFIERSKAHKVLEENIHPQCPYCNQHGMKRASVVLAYRSFMVDSYGEDFVKAMEQTANDVVKRSRPDVEDQIREIKRRNTELESQL